MRFKAWREEFESEGTAFDAEQARWAALIESRLKADADGMERFGDYDFDGHPFDGRGGYAEAERVFGGRAALERLLESLNAAVFG